MPEVLMLTPFLMLTQDACPECERLKSMLARPLKGQFDHQIRQVHRQNDAEEFVALVEQHSLRRTPILIHASSGQILTRTDLLSEVKAFLSR